MKTTAYFKQYYSLLLVCLCFVHPLRAQVIDAASCSQADVEQAIAAANTGDTVLVPAGTCNWSGLSLDKAITLKGSAETTIHVSENTITKQSAGIIRIQGFTFTKTGGGNQSKGFHINGSWLSAEPVIIENNAFIISATGLFRINVPGGVIIAGNTFTGDWDDSFIQPKDDQDDQNSWGTDHSMGMKDSSGKINLYVENNSFHGGTNQGIDCDAASRCVYRYNTLTYSSFNTHGKASGQTA